MAFIQTIKAQFRPVVETEQLERTTEGDMQEEPVADEKAVVSTVDDSVQGGLTTIQAAQAIWGLKGRWLLIIGIAVLMILYELDNSTVYIYNNYSTSEFNALSKVTTLGTANGIVFSVVKPPIAKLSNVIGRGQTYLLTLSCYIISYIIMASAKTFNSYAAGAVLYTIGQSGTNTMNDITLSDVTTARWRGFAIGLSFFPFLITPWVAAFIVDSVVHGIGWRWGIGMFAILMPVGASMIITTLLYYQTRAKQMGLAPTPRINIYSFCSNIDLGGVILFSGGFALLLLPLTLAGSSPDRWSTPYVPALISVGGFLLIMLPFYEARLARHPILPTSFFRSRTIVICLIVIMLDSLGFSCTHTYLYAWSTIARNFGARNATFLLYTNGVMQTLAGISAGAIMAWSRRYKWLMFAGAVVRIIGYGVMVRLRGAENPVAELFIVQLVQGIGSGIIQTAVLVPSQISVPHAKMPEITALVICFSILGSTLGATVAGTIYTNSFKPALWHRLGNNATSTLVDSLYNSITGQVPAWGTPERNAIDQAYSDVLRYMTYGALGACVPALFLLPILPNNELPDRNNLVEE